MSQVVLISKLIEKIARQTLPCSSLVKTKYSDESKFRGREENNFEFVFENEYFPDTDGVVFDAATVDGEEESDEIEELVEGNESMNDLNDLFINIVTF